MGVRIAAGLVFAAVFLGSMYLGAWTTLGFVTFLTVVAAWEMVDAIRAKGCKARRWPALTFSVLYMLVAQVAGPEHIFTFMVFITLVALSSLVLTRGSLAADMLGTLTPFLYPLNLFAFMGIVLMLPMEVWRTLLLCAVSFACMNDVGAYFVGTKLGRHKLAPHISPKKTIEGSVGGLIVGTLTGVVFYNLQSMWHAELPLYFYLTAGFCCSLTGQVGDLVASAIKRHCGIKDFGKIVPGHGGVLDRLDSVVFSLPTAYVVYVMYALLTAA